MADETWARSYCPLCGTVWEVSSTTNKFRYVSLIAVPVPLERACPVCVRGKRPVLGADLPIFPEDDCEWEPVHAE